MTKQLTNIAVQYDSPTMINLSWEYDGARFHIWADIQTGTFINPQKLFKKPPKGTTTHDAGYFRTRHLDATSKSSAQLIARAIAFADRGELLAKAKAEYEAKQAAEETARNDRAARLKLARELFAKMREAATSYPQTKLEPFTREELLALLEYAPED
jgi:hypothetical protein